VPESAQFARTPSLEVSNSSLAPEFSNPAMQANQPRTIKLGAHRLRLCALDHQPQHERYLPEEGRLGNRKYLALILWPEHAGKAQGKVGEAAERQPHAQKLAEVTLGRCYRIA
jgi:hypothetical protein